MRIGVGLPFKDKQGLPLDAAGLGQRARWIEDAGLDAAWMGDASFRRLATWPDPMMWLLTVAAATSRIEVGTAIYQVPLRSPVDLAQQFLTMRALLLIDLAICAAVIMVAAAVLVMRRRRGAAPRYRAAITHYLRRPDTSKKMASACCSVSRR